LLNCEPVNPLRYLKYRLFVSLSRGVRDAGKTPEVIWQEKWKQTIERRAVARDTACLMMTVRQSKPKGERYERN
jgi:hypothetical protein